MGAVIHIGPNPCPLNEVTTIDKAWHSAVGSVLSQLRHVDFTGPGLKWDFADAFQRQCYPLLAAWVGDYPEQFMVAHLSYGSCSMCEIPQSAPMGHSSFQPLNYSRDQDIELELEEDNKIDALHTRDVHAVHNKFWQYPLGNVYWLWQHDEVHQLLRGLVND
jgi:hypothetical protein